MTIIKWVLRRVRSSLQALMASRGGEGGGGGGGGGLLCRETSRSASFHRRSTSTAAAASKLARLQMRRPKTHPDLLGSSTGRLSRSADQRRVPAKVLVNVTVQRNLGPLQVMASTEWTVEKLIEEALKQYRKEGRRPLLTTTVVEPSAFGLHYSLFSLERLVNKKN